MICAICGCTEKEARELCKYKKIVRDIETILHPGYFIDGAPELKQFRRLYKVIKLKYFPETKTRRQRINTMINNLDRLFNERDYFGTNWNMTDLIDLLKELRDREEDE